MKRSNVLMICVDHWSAALLGDAGHPAMMTPTLDYLAREGVRFENAYSSCPVCIPARRSLMTGLTPRGHGDRVYKEKEPMPDVPTLADAFVGAGYQAYAVGKLHVYPQRCRIGFQDVILMEEGRNEFGVVDDYQIWLGEHGYFPDEYAHGMGNNVYYTRPWHLPEEAHPTVWATKQMVKTIQRLEPGKPAFLYMSYQFPHPPLVPLQPYLDMYDLAEIDAPATDDDWSLADNYPMRVLRGIQRDIYNYSEKEMRLARRAFYATCTHIDHQIRILLGALREKNMQNDTVILFTSDHGDMLFDHNLLCKFMFYEGAANVPLIISGIPVQERLGADRNKLAASEDIMPTLLELCGIPVPGHVEGMPLLTDAKRDSLYCEITEGVNATRMVHDGRHKLIYYPAGNLFHLFDLEKDPREKHNVADDPAYAGVKKALSDFLIGKLYGGDEAWVKDGELVGIPQPAFKPKVDFGLYNQRGLHWPLPLGYTTSGNVRSGV